MLKDIELRPGDVLCVRGDMPVVSAGIRLVEWFLSKDGEATYGHTAIVGTEGGTLLDTLWRVRWSHIDRYVGQQMIIARPTHTLRGIVIDEAAKRMALKMISAADHGRFYPVHRIPLHLFWPLPKFLSAGRQKVCSERGAWCCCILGAMDEPWAGITPDDLADRFRRWHNFTVIFEGHWPGTNT